MADLRTEVIKLARENPSLRKHLVPLLRKQAGAFEDFIEDQKFENPETGNQVYFNSLPDDEQKRVRGRWEDSQEGKKDDEGHGLGLQDPYDGDKKAQKVGGRPPTGKAKAAAEWVQDMLNGRGGLPSEALYAKLDREHGKVEVTGVNPILIVFNDRSQLKLYKDGGKYSVDDGD